MYSRNKPRRDRHYQIKKTGIKDDIIDKQILAIHRAIVEKLITHPALLQQVEAKIAERKEQGRMGYGEYITWTSLLEIADDPDAFREGVLENSPKMRRLRRKTPFVGILSEDERQAALDTGALEKLSNVGYLFN